MSSPTTPNKNAPKSYAAAVSPPRPIVPAVARLSLENTPPLAITTEAFPPLSAATKKTSPLGKKRKSTPLILLKIVIF